MPVFRTQILLGVGDAGWSETYFMTAASHDAAFTAISPVATARMALAKSDVKVRVIRISQEGVKGDSLLKPSPAPQGTYAAAGANTFDPAVALLVTAYTADHLAWTHWFLRGLSTDVVSTAEPFQLVAAPPAAWNTALANYQSALVANVQIYTKKPNPPGDRHTVAIATTGFSTFLPIRKAGRPFGLRRGRRVTV